MRVMVQHRVHKQKVKKLLAATQEVFEAVVLPNGGILAAPVGFPVYPAGVENYNFVWIRDACFVLAALVRLGNPKPAEGFFRWLLERAEDFQETGFLANAYAPHGPYQGSRLSLEEVQIPPALQAERQKFNFYGLQFQPDQYGHLLWAVYFYLTHLKKPPNSTIQELVRVIVRGLESFWQGDSFTIPYFNLWEDYIARPQDKANFAYTLAIIWQGLEMCSKVLKLPGRAVQLKEEFRTAFQKCFGEAGERCLPVSYLYQGSSQADTGAAQYDSVIAGLVWPSRAIRPTDKQFLARVRQVEIANSTDSGGLKRHPQGGYSGRLQAGRYILDGEGAWPIINFWFAILWSQAGETEKALRYFNWVLDRVDRYIPEQIFDDPAKPSITPLAWSHAMFVFAADFLGLLKEG